MPQDLNGRSVDGQFYLPWNSSKFLNALPFAPLQLPRAGQSSHRPFPVVRDPITIRGVLRSPNSFRIRLEVLPSSEPSPVQLTFLELVKGEHVPGPLFSLPTMEIQVKSTHIFQVAGTSSELPSDDPCSSNAAAPHARRRREKDFGVIIRCPERAVRVVAHQQLCCQEGLGQSLGRCRFPFSRLAKRCCS